MIGSPQIRFLRCCPLATYVARCRSLCTSSEKEMDFKLIKMDWKGENNNVGLIQVNSQKGYNYLGKEMLQELALALQLFDREENVGATVITGNERVFAAGADLQEMKDLTYTQCYLQDFPIFAKAIKAIKKPVIAAVNGFALGGGCELAMLCDIIYAGENAKFSQPEILLGTIPGACGTQMLTRAIGKSKSMEMCLTGERFSAAEALRLGVVSKVFQTKRCVDEAIILGDRISKNSHFANILCKEAVNKGYDMGLTEGCNYARRLFHMTFATDDRKEGMTAFLEKREPKFKGS